MANPKKVTFSADSTKSILSVSGEVHTCGDSDTEGNSHEVPDYPSG